MTAEEHGPACAGCQILGMRVAIAAVLDGGFVIPEPVRYLLANAIGRHDPQIIDLDDLTQNSSGPFANLFIETATITGAKPGVVVYRRPPGWNPPPDQTYYFYSVGACPNGEHPFPERCTLCGFFREVCPQPCEHLSAEDAREGRTCAQHPCICEQEGER